MKRLLLPLTWMLVLCTIFPFGLPSRFETSGFAEQAKTGRSSKAVRPRSSSRNATYRAIRLAAVAAPTSLEKAPVAISPTAVDTAVAANDTAANTTTLSAASTTAAASATIPVAPSSNPVASTPRIVGRVISMRAIVSGKTQRATVMLPNANSTVGEALRAMKITLDPLDRVAPLAGRPAYDGLTVRVTRVRADIQTRVKFVPFERLYQPTDNLERGAKQTVQSGRSGTVEVVERVWSRDGRVTMREYVSQRVKQASQPQIVALGARSHYLPGRVPYHNRYARAYALSSRGGSPRDRYATDSAPLEAGTFRAKRSIYLVATGYSPDPSENGGYTTTATGLPIGYGAAAVDPRVIPLGTRMYVEGYGYAFACDTGGAIKGHRIDLAYDSYGVANSKGHKRVRVWILGK